MEVFVIPIGRERYELYCDTSGEAEEDGDATAPGGLFGRLRQRFGAVLRAAEQRQRRNSEPFVESASWLGRLQDRLLGWVVQRIAEQRLLWNLRRHESAVAVHPDDITFAQALGLVRRILQRDYERHRIWLVLDTCGLVASGPLALVPGPNVLAYYFAFRVVGHWLSMRGATQGLHRATWSGRPSPPLAELRHVAALDAGARAARLDEIAAHLRLPNLSTFLDRVTVRHA